jgi:hypothetical protein
VCRPHPFNRERTANGTGGDANMAGRGTPTVTECTTTAGPMRAGPPTAGPPTADGGRLGPADQLRTSRHVQRCHSCAAESADLRAVTLALDLLTPADIAEIIAEHRPAR